jgi:hypothetical protein
VLTSHQTHFFSLTSCLCAIWDFVSSWHAFTGSCHFLQWPCIVLVCAFLVHYPQQNCLAMTIPLFLLLQHCTAVILRLQRHPLDQPCLSHTICRSPACVGPTLGIFVALHCTSYYLVVNTFPKGLLSTVMQALPPTTQQITYKRKALHSLTPSKFLAILNLPTSLHLRNDRINVVGGHKM